MISISAIGANMWLRAGVVLALFVTGLIAASAEDDGPPPCAPAPIGYIDPLLLRPRTNVIGAATSARKSAVGVTGRELSTGVPVRG